MSMETWERQCFLADYRRKIGEAEADLSTGKVVEVADAAADLKLKYGHL